jgi:hypothetical protein
MYGPRTRRLSYADSPQWKVMIVDEDSRKLIDNVVKEDEILDLNITSMAPLPFSVAIF